MKFTFGGYEFDTELEYVAVDCGVVKVEMYSDRLLKVCSDCGFKTLNESGIDVFFADASKVSTPKKV